MRSTFTMTHHCVRSKVFDFVYVSVENALYWFYIARTRYSDSWTELKILFRRSKVQKVSFCVKLVSDMQVKWMKLNIYQIQVTTFYLYDINIRNILWKNFFIFYHSMANSDKWSKILILDGTRKIPIQAVELRNE